MKTNAALSLKVLALAALFSFAATAAWAEDKAKPDATGTWKWTRKTPGGQEQEISATLKQDGEKLTGKVMSPLGEVEIKEGKVKDGELSFEITFERDGNEITAKFSGKLNGDKIKGKVEIGGAGDKRTLDWEPKRQAEDKKSEPIDIRTAWTCLVIPNEPRFHSSQNSLPPLVAGPDRTAVLVHWPAQAGGLVAESR